MIATRPLTEVFRREYEATHGDLDAAVAAVATTVKAQLELPLAPLPTQPVELRVIVVHKYPALVDHTTPAERSTQRVLAAVADEFEVEVRSLVGRWACRKKHHAEARWVAAAMLRGRGMSLSECGRAVGLRDHSTVIYGLRQIETRADLQAALARVREALGDAPAPAADSGPATLSHEIEAA